MIRETADCVVIGGGPAGSTFAGVVKKYSPHLRIVLLEQEHFPRYHIGESTIPAANGALRDLGVYDDLERSGFVKKMGIVFVWGEDRKPWNADFLRVRDVGGDGHTVDVTGQDFTSILGELRTRETPVTAFNVQRSDFDKMLLDRAREIGVDAREGTRVTEILKDPKGAISGVTWTDDRGRKGRIDAPFLMDASGLSSILTRRDRVFDPDMNNFAVYGYLKNADWKVTFNGKRDRSTVFIAAVEKGWIWYFPIRQDVMSVGAVTRRDHFTDRLKDVDLEAFWWEMLQSCPEVKDLVKNASVRTDILPNGQRVAASQDWSSWAKEPVGDGWAAAGDAAIFVDPILSSGVTLALQSGHRAAYTFNTARFRPDLPSRSLWNAYADYIRGEYGAFLRLARHFYGNHKAAESWWWEAESLVNRTGRLELDPHQSFTMATCGFFPVMRAISPEVVGSLLNHLSGNKDLEKHRPDFLNVFRQTGVPDAAALAKCALETVAPFRLDLRTEPTTAREELGYLHVYHDLVTDDPRLTHRTAAVPWRIDPSLAPVVQAIPQQQTVSSLLTTAESLVPTSETVPNVRDATLDLVRVAAMKGFVRLTPEAS